VAYFFLSCISLCARCRFAKYRDVMEAVHNFHGVLLACLVLAFEEVSASSSLFERIQVSRCVCACVECRCACVGC
jgi:hypothetical protein